MIKWNDFKKTILILLTYGGALYLSGNEEIVSTQNEEVSQENPEEGGALEPLSISQTYFPLLNLIGSVLMPLIIVLGLNYQATQSIYRLIILTFICLFSLLVAWIYYRAVQSELFPIKSKAAFHFLNLICILCGLVILFVLVELTKNNPQSPSIMNNEGYSYQVLGGGYLFLGLTIEWAIGIVYDFSFDENISTLTEDHDIANIIKDGLFFLIIVGGSTWMEQYFLLNPLLHEDQHLKRDIDAIRLPTVNHLLKGLFNTNAKKGILLIYSLLALLKYKFYKKYKLYMKKDIDLQIEKGSTAIIGSILSSCYLLKIMSSFIPKYGQLLIIIIFFGIMISHSLLERVELGIDLLIQKWNLEAIVVETNEMKSIDE